MLPIRQASPLVCSELKAPCHCPVSQGSGVKEKAASRGETEGEIGEGISVLWNPFGKCDDVKVSGEGDDVGR